MSLSRWSLLVVFVCFAAFLSGCRSGGTVRGGSLTEDLERVDVLDGDYALLDSWTEDDLGEPVLDETFENVLFGYDSKRVSAGERVNVEAVADYMQRNPGTRAVLLGHCDERGSREYNMALGEHRGMAVRAYLIGLDVDGSRIMPKSYGEEKPADPSHNERAWTANRRVEFLLYR